MHESEETESTPLPETSPATDSPGERWFREQAERRDRELIGILSRVRRDRPELRYLVVGYDGSGDEGFVQYAGFVRTEAEAEAADAWTAPEGLVVPEGVDAGSLGELVHEFPPESYQDNEGGRGVVRIELETGEVDVAHAWYVTDTKEDPRAFDLGPISPAADEGTGREPTDRSDDH